MIYPIPEVEEALAHALMTENFWWNRYWFAKDELEKRVALTCYEGMKKARYVVANAMVKAYVEAYGKTKMTEFYVNQRLNRIENDSKRM